MDRKKVAAGALALYMLTGVVLGLEAKSYMRALNYSFTAYYAALWPWFLISANVESVPAPPIYSWFFTFK